MTWCCSDWFDATAALLKENKTKRNAVVYFLTLRSAVGSSASAVFWSRDWKRPMRSLESGRGVYTVESFRSGVRLAADLTLNLSIGMFRLFHEVMASCNV